MKRTLQRIYNPLVKDFLRIANQQERSAGANSRSKQQERSTGAINRSKQQERSAGAISRSKSQEQSIVKNEEGKI